MDQNIRVLLSESYRYHLKLKVHFSRYISPENSFPGIGGTYTSSKSHSRISADILAWRRHIGTGLSVIHVSLSRVYDSDDWIDAPDFYESLFWKDSDPVSGLGGWGDPNADFRVPDGGFHKLPLSYPSPHTVRRNFTLRSFDQPIPSPLVTDKLKMSNTSFTASVIEAILRSPAGDFKGFQKVLEAIEVRNMDIIIIRDRVPHLDVTSGPTQFRARDRGRVSCFVISYASHFSPSAASSDMVGGCPENAPSNCKPGPSWSPNGAFTYNSKVILCVDVDALYRSTFFFASCGE
jgi:hypothetical protein